MICQFSEVIGEDINFFSTCNKVIEHWFWRENTASFGFYLVHIRRIFYASLGLQPCTIFAHKRRSWFFDQDRRKRDQHAPGGNYGHSILHP